MLATSITLLAAGANGLLIQAGAPAGPAALAPRPASLSPRVGAITAAYNPQPSKAKPRKVKSKDPKQKTKGPADPAAAMQLVPEQVFWEGPPSITETVIPGLSLFTVIGVIPFSAALARQAWTRYKLTNKRIEVCSGFQGKDVVQVTYREVRDIKWLRRFGGQCGDMVLTLNDGVKLEIRSLSEFDRNLKFIFDQCADGLAEDCFYPDKPAQVFLDKVASGEEPPVALPAAESAAAESTSE